MKISYGDMNNRLNISILFLGIFIFSNIALQCQNLLLKAKDLAGPAPGAVGAVCGDRRRRAVEYVDLGGGVPRYPAHFVSRTAGDFPADRVLFGLAAVEVVLEAQGDQRAVDFRRGGSAVCGQRVTLPAAARRRNGPGHLLLALRSNSP